MASTAADFSSAWPWAGTGVLWSVSGGVLSSQAFVQKMAGSSKGDLNFVQISDSHIGYLAKS